MLKYLAFVFLFSSWPVSMVRAEAVAVAKEGSALDGYQEAVRSQMQELISSTLNDFFTHNGRDKPEHIEVKSHADFDMSTREPRVRELLLDVSMTSDQPAAVLREARQRIMRTLRGNGYRFEPASTTAEAQMPLVKLNLDVQGVDRPDQTNGLREYATFAALAGGCIAFFGLTMLVVLRPLRLRGKSRTSRAVAAAADLPPIPSQGPAVFHASSAGLPPLTAGTYPKDTPQVDPELV